MRTRRTLPIVVVGAVLLLATMPVWAHHALIAQYAADKPITLRGTVTKVEWVNPHGWIYMDVKGADARVENWAVETGTAGRMLSLGLRKTDFQPGTEIIVGGFLAKNTMRTVAGWIVTFPDREAAFPARGQASFPLGR